MVYSFIFSRKYKIKIKYENATIEIPIYFFKL